MGLDVMSQDAQLGRQFLEHNQIESLETQARDTDDDERERARPMQA